MKEPWDVVNWQRSFFPLVAFFTINDILDLIKYGGRRTIVAHTGLPQASPGYGYFTLVHLFALDKLMKLGLRIISSFQRGKPRLREVNLLKVTWLVSSRTK